MTLTAVITPESDGGYVAFNPGTGTFSQGDSVVAAIASLKEAADLYLEKFSLESPEQP